MTYRYSSLPGQVPAVTSSEPSDATITVGPKARTSMLKVRDVVLVLLVAQTTSIVLLMQYCQQL